MGLAVAYTSTGGVASEEPLASSIGAEIITRGGNAVDAAIATSFALSVLIPHLGGIGGDYFALVRMPDGETYFVNGSGHSPSRLTKKLLEERGLDRVPETGPLSPVVPGMVDALYLLWKRFGSLEWRTLVEPAARLAREGFPAPPSLVRAIKAYRGLLEADPGSRETYLEQGVEEGRLVSFPGLARLLDLVAEDPRSFYSDEPAEAVEEYLATRGGVLTRGDMRAYHAFTGEPVALEYRGWKVVEMPPNTQGITTLHILALLEDEDTPADPLDRLPALLSASLPAYWARDRYIGDPRYMRYKPGELLSKEFIEELRRVKRRGLEDAPRGSGDTTFYVTLDGEGVAVAGIQSLFNPFGSGVTEPRFQVTLNSRAQSFTLEEGHPNMLLPFKRPLHTLSAMILVGPSEDRVYLLGTSGGHLRPQIHALLATSIIDHGFSLEQAIGSPRALWVPGTRRIVVDKGYEDRVKGLEGYSVSPGRTGVAAGLEIRPEQGVGLLVTDWRGDGVPVPALRL